MTQRTAYQDRIIRNYYQNFDQLAVQRLSELVTDLFLAEGAKARARLWQRARTTLEKLKIPAARIEHIEKADNPTLLANLVQELLSGQTPTGSTGSVSASAASKVSGAAPAALPRTRGAAPASPAKSQATTASKKPPASGARRSKGQ